MPKIYAHKGGAGYFSENTLKAFDFAIELGCTGAELDVQISKDGEVVVHHNDKLNHKFARKPDGNWITSEEETPLNQLKLAEIQQFTVGEPNPVTHNLKAWPNLLPDPNQAIPTLRQVIELARQKSDSFELVIEITTDIFDENHTWLPLVEKVLIIINETDFSHRVKFCSFNWNALLYIKQKILNIPLWFTTHPLSWLVSNEKLKPDIPPHETTLQKIRQAWLSGNALWYAGHQPKTFEDFPSVIQQLGGQAWFCYQTDVNLENLTNAHNQKIQLAAWSVNLKDPDTLKKLNLIDAICVDYPKYRFTKLTTEQKNMLVIADQVRSEKKWQQAEVLYEELLNLYDEYLPVSAYVGLAICQRINKKYNSSKDTLNKALKLFPNNIQIFIELAASNNSIKNWLEAVKYWHIVSQLTDNMSQLNIERSDLALKESGIFSLLNKTNHELKADFSDYLGGKIKPSLPDVHNFISKLKLAKKDIYSLHEFLCEFKAEEIKNNKFTYLLLCKEVLNTCIFKSREFYYNTAICAMYSGDWNLALLLWKKIYDDYGENALSQYDYNRLLKCCEMSDNWINYKDFLEDGLISFPNDKNLFYRHLIYTSRELLLNGNYEKSLRCTNKIVASGYPSFWAIDPTLLSKIRSESVINLPLQTHINTNKKFIIKKMIVANRSDGLGERLNAILNGVVLAKLTGYSFCFTWKSTIHNDNLDIKNENIIGHAIESVEDIFSKQFIEKFYTKSPPKGKFIEFSKNAGNLSQLASIEFNENLSGWYAPRLKLSEICTKGFLLDNYGYTEAFSELEFNDDIKHAIDLACSSMNEKYVALHLRSGDIFYGEYRKYVHYTYKGIVIPLAKWIIEDSISKGKKIVILGQDKLVINYFKTTYPQIIDTNDLIGDIKLNDTQKAFFDIYIMIKAENIYAGSSGFSKFAALVSSKEIMLPTSFINHSEQTEIIIKDLDANSDVYPRLQVAFAYWYAYYYGRSTKNYETIVMLLKKAIHYDTENQLYPLVLASIHNTHGYSEEAEKILRDLFSMVDDETKIYSVLKAQTLGKYNMQEYFNGLVIHNANGFYSNLVCNFIKLEINKV